MNTRTSRLKHSFNVAFDAVSVCVTISVLNTNLCENARPKFRRRQGGFVRSFTFPVVFFWEG